MKTSKKSHKAKVRDALLSGARLTNYGAFRQIGTVDFRKIISELRKTMTIKDEWATNKRNVKFKVYYCDEQDITRKVHATRMGFQKDTRA